MHVETFALYLPQLGAAASDHTPEPRQKLETDGPHAALELGARHHGAIDLLLTDVVMPAMSYEQLGDRPPAEGPELEFLYASAKASISTAACSRPKYGS